MMKEKHLKILEKFVRTKNDGVDMNSEYLQISVSSALSAMAVQQDEIDELRRENETLTFGGGRLIGELKELRDKYQTLHGLIQFCSCDQPDFYHGDNTTCKRCGRAFDPEIK